jgi:hypothetical protein
MSTLGKILLFVNVLLAAGVFYLATQDYAKRRQLNEALVKNSLVLNGLPTDSNKGDSSDAVTVGIYGLNGQYAEEAIPKKLLDSIFSGANGAAFERTGSPTSQVDELQAVYTKLLQDVEKANDPKQQLVKICGGNQSSNAGAVFVPGILLMMSDTYEERLALRRLADASPDRVAASVKECKDRLKSRFDSAIDVPNPDAPETLRKKVEELKTKILAAPNDVAIKNQLTALAGAGPTGPCANESERRLRIAQVLMQASPSADWQKRVAYVVGLKTYQAAVTEQAGRLDLMAQQTRDLRYSDQGAFDQEYEQLASLALEQSKLNSQQSRLVKGWQGHLAAATELKNSRTTQLNGLKTQLATVTGEVNKKLAEQAAVESKLFEVQREVGLTLRETGRLEQELRKREGP